MTKQTLHIVRK